MTRVATSTRATNGQPPTMTAPSAPVAITRLETARCRNAGSNALPGGSAISPLAPVVLAQCVAQVLIAEIGPAEGHEHELGVGELPQQEIADALLSAGADQEVRV